MNMENNFPIDTIVTYNSFFHTSSDRLIPIIALNP